VGAGDAAASHNKTFWTKFIRFGRNLGKLKRNMGKIEAEFGQK